MAIREEDKKIIRELFAEELKKFEIQQDIKSIIGEEVSELFRSNRYIFEKHIEIFDGKNIQVGIKNGTKIGTATNQLLSFYGVSPVVQQTALTAKDGGAINSGDAGTDVIIGNNRTRIEELKVALQNLGFIA